jgi:hypothetical protein
MDLKLKWHTPLPLIASSSKHGIYTVDLDDIPNVPGIYIFFRVYKTKHEALYIGQTIRLSTRIREQLHNDTLMTGIQHATRGSRQLVFGAFNAKNGQAKTSQKLEQSLLRMEHALIRHYLSLGDQLLNVRGARVVKHSLTSDRSSVRKFIPRVLYFE